MKIKYLLVIIGLLPIISHSQAEDFYAPWTKSKITNNTKYPVVITAGYTIPGCKLKTMVGMPCTQRGGSGNCDYYGCRPHQDVKLTLKPGKTITVIPESNGYPADAIEGEPAIPGTISGDALIIELPFITDPKTKKQVATQVTPVKIDNPPVKNYKISFDGKNLKVDQSPL